MTAHKWTIGFTALVFVASCGWRAGAQKKVPAPAKPEPTQLVILDTDIGDDLDDAFALALLLHSPEVKLLGISTTFGDTELRARLVDRYLDAIDRAQIPVNIGDATPPHGHFTQATYARQQQPRRYGDATDFLLRNIRLHPGQITLIAIGPLFNIQAAIERDLLTFRKLKRVVMMGGSIYRGYDNGNAANNPPPSAEWNIRCDPAGARALLESGVPVYIMPLDSTQVRLTQPELSTIFAYGSPLTDQLTLLYHEWTGAGAWQSPTFFDPVAAAYAIRPSLCPTKPLRLDVDDQGFTRPVVGAPNAQVCLRSDVNGFVQFFSSRILSDTAH